MTIRERNEHLLLGKPGIGTYKAFPESEPAADFSVFMTPSGLPSAVYGGVYLHSRHDPLRETLRLADRELSGKRPRTIVVYGFGLGYMSEVLLEKAPEAELFIVEPDIRLFQAALSSRDLGAVIASERTVFCIGTEPETVATVLDRREDEQYMVFRLRSVYEKDRDYYEKIDSLLAGLLRRKQINRNTLARFGRLWVRNLVRNLSLAGSMPGIRELEGKFRGIPALIVAAGPSLDSLLPLLPEIRRRCLIVAVDTSLRACLREGVDPDFTVVVDPQYWNTRHLDWAGSTESILISESSTHPRIFRTRFGRIFFCSSIFPMGEYLERRTGFKGRLGAGGSVSTSAWDFARLLGGSPLFIAGMDLGFPALQTHFSGSFFEHRVHTSSKRLLPGETSSFLALHDAGPFPVPSNDGKTVLTDNRLIVYSQWFENQMHLHPDCTTLNLSPGGVAINGMPNAPVERLLELPPVREQIDSIIAVLRSAAEVPKENAGRLPEALSSLIAELEVLDGLAREGLEVCTQLVEQFSAMAPLDALLSRLNSIDERIMSVPARDVAGFLLQSVRDRLAEPEETAGGLTVIENSATLYRELHESIDYHLRLLKPAAAGHTPD